MARMWRPGLIGGFAIFELRDKEEAVAAPSIHAAPQGLHAGWEGRARFGVCRP